MSDIRDTLRVTLKLDDPVLVEYQRTEYHEEDGYGRETIHYLGLEGDVIPAFLFRPETPSGTGVVVFHQHAGQFHLGKSEVAGLAGNTFQAFGPALAKRGITVLAPDAITFEDRRTSGTGVEPGVGESDWLQHFNAMGYRLVDGDTLMRKCLDDAQRAVSVLLAEPGVRPENVGVCGHSYGGTTAMYLAAVDPRCCFACMSGSVCSFAQRKRSGTGLGMIELVPGIAARMDTHDIFRALAPRPAFVLSATEDPYSQDADQVVGRSGLECEHMRVEGKHPLDEARFDAIVEWLTQRAKPRP